MITYTSTNQKMTPENKLGRRPLFTPYEAFKLLENRKYFGSDCTVNRFIEEMVAAGEMPRPCSPASMHRLLTGRMFPTLAVYNDDGQPTDKRYNYADVMRASPGHPGREGTIRDVLADGLPRMSAKQKEFFNSIKAAIKDDTTVQVRIQMQHELNTLLHRIAALTDRVSVLEARK